MWREVDSQQGSEEMEPRGGANQYIEGGLVFTNHKRSLQTCGRVHEGAVEVFELPTALDRPMDRR